MGLHILKINDILELQDGFFKVKEFIEGVRVSIVPCPSSEVPDIFLKRFAKRKGTRGTPHPMTISDEFEGKVIRNDVEIEVISRSRFRRVKGIK